MGKEKTIKDSCHITFLYNEYLLHCPFICTESQMRDKLISCFSGMFGGFTDQSSTLFNFDQIKLLKDPVVPPCVASLSEAGLTTGEYAP